MSRDDQYVNAIMRNTIVDMVNISFSASSVVEDASRATKSTSQVFAYRLLLSVNIKPRYIPSNDLHLRCTVDLTLTSGDTCLFDASYRIACCQLCS